MSYFRNRRIYDIILYCMILLVSCREKKPSVSEEQYRTTREQMPEVNRILLAKDKMRIEGYIERQELDMRESPTGLWYVVDNPDSGDFVKPGMTVNVKYKLTLLEGKECYSSEKNGIKSFRVGRGNVESGLEEGIRMMKVGGSAKFIMPPHLAHGLPGDGDCIPARAIIVYDIQVLSAE